jgi:hypothetical protein
MNNTVQYNGRTITLSNLDMSKRCYVGSWRRRLWEWRAWRAGEIPFWRLLYL